MSGPLPPALAPITVPLSWLYRQAVAWRNARFDRDPGGLIARLDVPVVSVGNITTGGVGKTPMVAWIAHQLARDDIQVVIAMRGYKARSGEPGDEEREYGWRLPNTPVVANPDRTSALRRFLTQRRVDLVLLDDGFQHRQLHRDLDLVLIDATRPALDARLLPAGHLREPVSALQRADAVVVTRAATADARLAAGIERWHGRAPLAWARHAWRDVEAFGPGAGTRPVDALNGLRVITLLGIGHPESVRRQVEAHGATIVHDVSVRDHAAHDAATASALEQHRRRHGADAVVTTAKDWVKLREVLDSSVPVLIPRVELDLFEGADALMNRIRALLLT